MAHTTLKEFLEAAARKRQVNTGAQPEYVKLLKDPPPPKQHTLDDAKKRLAHLLRTKCPGYSFTPEHVEAIGAYISHRVEGDAKKWFIVMGNFGSGKTFLFEVLSEWVALYNNTRKKRHQVISVHDLKSKYKQIGDEAFNEWNARNVCIDDLGAESITKHFGEEEDIMRRFLEQRYNLRHKVTTDIITNLTMDELAQRYGGRIESRLNEVGVKMKIGASIDAVDSRKQKQ